MSALGTCIHMSAERGGAAAQDCVQYFEAQPGKPLLAALEEAFSGCADDIGHLNGRPRHLLGTVPRIVAPGKRQRVEGTRSGVQALLRKVEIDGGLFQIAMAQQNLDGP